MLGDDIGKRMFDHPDRKREIVRLLLQELESMGYEYRFEAIWLEKPWKHLNRNPP